MCICIHQMGSDVMRNPPPFKTRTLVLCKFKQLLRNPITAFTIRLWNGANEGSGVCWGAVRVTLDEEVHRGGSRSTAGLHCAHVLAFIRHVHILNLDGELLLIQGHQTHSGIHWPFIFSSIQYAGPVKPSSVCDNVSLCAPVTGYRDKYSF